MDVNGFHVPQHELVGLELTDTVHCDDVMIELNLSPEDLMVPVPAYVRRDRLLIIQEVLSVQYVMILIAYYMYDIFVNNSNMKLLY